MRRSSADPSRLRRLAEDAGSAAIEFLGAGVLLLVPIAYGAVTVAQVEQAVFATELAARNAARTLVAGTPSAELLAESHIRYALEDAGFSSEAVGVEVGCAPDPDCADPGGTLTVTVRIDVPVPLLPGASDWLTIPVAGSATFPRNDQGR